MATQFVRRFHIFRTLNRHITLVHGYVAVATQLLSYPATYLCSQVASVSSVLEWLGILQLSQRPALMPQAH